MSSNHYRRGGRSRSGIDELLLVRSVFIFMVLGVLVMVMVDAVKHAVVLLFGIVVGFVLVGVAGGVLLLVHADGVLGLVEEGLVGSGGAGAGAGGAGGVAGGTRRAGVVVLDAGDLVGGGLGGRLVGVGHHITVRAVWSVHWSRFTEREDAGGGMLTAGPCR